MATDPRDSPAGPARRCRAGPRSGGGQPPGTARPRPGTAARPAAWNLPRAAARRRGAAGRGRGGVRSLIARGIVGTRRPIPGHLGRDDHGVDLGPRADDGRNRPGDRIEWRRHRRLRTGGDDARGLRGRRVGCPRRRQESRSHQDIEPGRRRAQGVDPVALIVFHLNFGRSHDRTIARLCARGSCRMADVALGIDLDLVQGFAAGRDVHDPANGPGRAARRCPEAPRHGRTGRRNCAPVAAPLPHAVGGQHERIAGIRAAASVASCRPAPRTVHAARMSPNHTPRGG